jgi:hypothetical protein
MSDKADRAGLEIAGVAVERLWRLAPSPIGPSDYTPQANDLQKVFGLLRHSKLDILDSACVGEMFHFDKRQASYYIEAAKELRLLTKLGPDAYRYTDVGAKVRTLGEDRALAAFVGAVLSVPVILRVLTEIKRSTSHSLSRRELLVIVRECSGGRYTGNTLGRRADSVVAWFRWLENNSEFTASDETIE